jgi:putative ABC transport system permease protein
MFRSPEEHLARKGRLVLTSLAVIAGTAFLSGVFVFSDTIKGSFDKLFANAYARTPMRSSARPTSSRVTSATRPATNMPTARGRRRGSSPRRCVGAGDVRASPCHRHRRR